MTKPREKTREELTAEIEEGKKKIQLHRKRMEYSQVSHQYLQLIPPFSNTMLYNQIKIAAVKSAAIFNPEIKRNSTLNYSEFLPQIFRYY